jgi:hypothetical protein
MSGGSVFVVTYTVHATWRDNLTGDKVVLATDMIKVLNLLHTRQPPKHLYLSMSGGSVFVVTYTVHATWRDNLTGDKVVLATDMIKVLVQFLQYTAIIGSVSVPWPLFNLKRWFQAVNIPFAGSTGESLSLDCWLVAIPSKLPLAMQRQMVYFLAPVFVLLALVALLWLFWVLGRWVVPLVRRPKEGSTPQPAMSVVRKMPITLMVVAFYSYPTLLRASLSLFACLRIDRSPNLRDDTFVPPPRSTTQQAINNNNNNNNNASGPPPNPVTP